MNTMTNLTRIITALQQDAAKIGVSLAVLLVVINAIIIMFDNDTSPTARTHRWERLRRVLICAAIIAIAGVLVQFVTSIGGML